MPPKRAPKDTLTPAEKELLDIAVHLYCGVKYNEEHKGEVSEAWLMQGIEEELVRVAPSYMTQITHWEGQDLVDKIFHDECNTPRVHPVIILIAEEWHHAGNTQTMPDFGNFSLTKVAEQCALGAAQYPQWIGKLHMVDLSHLLGVSMRFVGGFLVRRVTMRTMRRRRRRRRRRRKRRRFQVHSINFYYMHMQLITLGFTDKSHSNAQSTCLTVLRQHPQTSLLQIRPEMLFRWTRMTTEARHPTRQGRGSMPLCSRPAWTGVYPRLSIRNAPALLDHRYV
jgi:hypothetical protein